MITVEERTPLSLVFSTPKGAQLRTSWSDIIRTSAESLERNTDFAVDAVADPFERCDGRLACVVRLLRGDYDRDRLVRADGLLERFDVYLETLEPGRYPKLLVYVVVIATPKADRVGAILVDTDEALRVFHEADRRDPGWQEQVEAGIKDRAVRALTRFVELRGIEQAIRMLRDVFTVDFRAAFEQSGHWAPYGSLILAGDVAGASVELDGLPVGTTSAPSTRLDGVRSGRRRLRVVHPEYAPLETEADVVAGSVVTIRPRLVRIADDGPGRAAVLWSGVGLAAVGAVLTGVAVAAAATGPRVVCALPDGASRTSCGSGTEWKTFAASDGGDPNPSGPLGAPLGLSLLGAGGTFAIGAALSDGGEVPWIPLVVGLVVGGAMYGVAVAVDGDSAFKVGR